MPSLGQVRTRVDARLADLWPIIVARQEAYMQARGRFFQGRRTHVLEPSHSTTVDGDAAPDNLSDHPTDQSESWLDLFPEYADLSLPMLIVMDIYESPRGHGFVGRVYARHNGTVYTRARGYGPDAGHYTHDWQAH